MLGMHEARYDDVSEKERTDPEGRRVACVACAYVPDGGLAQYNSRSFHTHEYHSYVHDRKVAFDFMMACHRKYDAGMEYDLHVVDNGSPDKEFQETLDALDVPVHRRENRMFSFGAWKWAYENLPDYDYYVFEEYDWVPSGDGWLSAFMEKWNGDKGIGLVGNLVEDRGWKGIEDKNKCLSDETVRKMQDGDINAAFMAKIAPHRKKMYNLDSEYYFVSRKVLDEVAERGWLMWDCAPMTWMSPAYNELAFSQPFLELGYKISSFNDGKHTMWYSIYNRGTINKWWHGWDRCAPMIPEQLRNFDEKIAKRYEWYEGAKSYASDA